MSDFEVRESGIIAPKPEPGFQEVMRVEEEASAAYFLTQIERLTLSKDDWIDLYNKAWANMRWWKRLALTAIVMNLVAWIWLAIVVWVQNR